MMRPLVAPVPDTAFTDGRDLGAASPLIRASLIRSRSTFRDPATATVQSILEEDELDEYRQKHPLSAVLPLIRSLLATPAQEHGLVMAVGDELGRLLWVEGDPGTRVKAEDMAFLPGADWSESSMGTSAPGIAIATGAAVQVRREQHFAPQVTAFSCSAVPLTDPGSGERIGFLDLTGGDRAVDSLILPYLRSTASAVQAHLATIRAGAAEGLRGGPEGPAGGGSRTGVVGHGPDEHHGGSDDVGQGHRADSRSYTMPTPRKARSSSADGPRLAVTGNHTPTLITASGAIALSRRHAEILAVLARGGGEGLDTAELAEAIYPGPVTQVTVRAEMTRLRKVVAAADPEGRLQLESRPYRLHGLTVDALEVEALLGRGSHRQALAEYPGPLLPASEAPRIVAWREELAATMREAILTDASAETLLSYLQRPEAEDDAEAWTLALKLLPPRSPKRASVLAHLERLEA